MLPDGRKMTSKAILLNGTFDLPARCLVCHMIQFNGHCGCGLCEEPGETARSGNGFSHVYTMSHEKAKTSSGHAKLRTKESTNENAEKAILTSSTVYYNNLEPIEHVSWRGKKTSSVKLFYPELVIGLRTN